MARRKDCREHTPKLTGAPVENALPPAVAPPLAGSSAREISAQTELLTEDLAPKRTKAEKPKTKKTKPNDQTARLHSSQASARLQIKQSGKGKQESWTVKTTSKPSTKVSKQTSFRVRVSDVGFRVCLVYYDAKGIRRERYLCYLSANEWKEMKSGSLSSFARVVYNKLIERRSKEDADDEKLSELSGRVIIFF